METCKNVLIQNLQLHNFDLFKAPSTSTSRLAFVSIKSTKLGGDLQPILGSLGQFLFDKNRFVQIF
jgi:hypothetical protein